MDLWNIARWVGFAATLAGGAALIVAALMTRTPIQHRPVRRALIFMGIGSIVFAGSQAVPDTQRVARLVAVWIAVAIVVPACVLLKRAAAKLKVATTQS